MPPLPNLRQERFAVEYARTANREKAVLAAGYKCKTLKDGSSSASVQATVLLKDPRMQDRVSELMRQVSSKMVLSKVKVLKEASRIAFSDVRNYVREDGCLVPLHELSDDAARAVKSIEVEELFAYGKKGEQVALGEEKTEDKGQRLLVGHVKKLQFWDKNVALTNLMKFFKLFEEEKSPGDVHNHYHFYMPENARQTPVQLNEPTGNGANGHDCFPLPNNGRS